MDQFTRDNTDGYTDAQLAALNAEWGEIVQAEGLECETDDGQQAWTHRAERLLRDYDQRHPID